MSPIHFPKDQPAVPQAGKKNRTQSSVHHADVVTDNPEHQQKQSSQKHKHPENEADKKPDETPQASGQATKIEGTSEATQREIVARGQERRQKNRRQNHQKVLLNTRSGHDRRKTPGQRKDDRAENNPSFGIDTKA